MNNLKASYNKILKTINFIEEKDNFLVQIRKPKLNDKNLIQLDTLFDELARLKK